MWSGKENNWVRNCTSHTRNILKVCRVINNLFYDFLIINYRVFISFQSSLNYQLKHFFRWLIKTYYGNKVTCWHHIFTAMKDMKNCTFVRNDFIFVNMWSMEKNEAKSEIYRDKVCAKNKINCHFAILCQSNEMDLHQIWSLLWPSLLICFKIIFAIIRTYMLNLR